MKYAIKFSLLIFLAFLTLTAKGQEPEPAITGLSDFTIFLDPGHSQRENMGLYNYSEAEKTLRVAWALRDMLEGQTDIAEVHLCRLTDNDVISLEGRTDLANQLGVDFYYSIHSDAGSPSANTLLTLYGGWKDNGVIVEKTPNGGRALGDILHTDMAQAKRIGTRGNYADRTFYDSANDHTNKFPYLSVNRRANMASLLSEASFHTNPWSQQHNLNKEWKEMEALSAFRSILEWKNIDRPAIGVATGTIKDKDTGLAINGATVTIGDKVYTTDTFESLFKKHSNDPEELRNGFYYIDGLTPGESVEVVFTCDGYETRTETLTIVSNPNGRTSENFSFLDVVLTNTTPAVVVNVEPAKPIDTFIPTDKLKITFSRKMDRASVESAISFNDTNIEPTYSWNDDFTLTISMGGLTFLTTYTLTIDGAIAKNSVTDQFFDGDNDGVAGGNYVLEFSTGAEDITAPELLDFSPTEGSTVMEIRPIIRLVYDEGIIAASIGVDAVKVKQMPGEELVAGQLNRTTVNGQSVLHFFPSVDLIRETTYKVEVAAGLSDAYGNTTDAFEFTFTVGDIPTYTKTLIDPFNGSVSSWWQPQQSGSSAGFVTEETSQEYSSSMAVLSEGSTGSMRFNFGWNLDLAPYVRLYLPPTAAQNKIHFTKSDILQLYLFGDGSEVEFRFVIRDGAGTSKYEASKWNKVNWIGWKLISWDMTKDNVYAWINGNGILGTAKSNMDGLHFRAVAGAAQKGTIYLDQFRFLSPESGTYAPQTSIDSKVSLYPNPVKEELNVASDELIKSIKIYSITGQLMMTELPEELKTTIHTHTLSRGVYVVEVVTEGGVSHSKIQVVK